MKKVLFAFIGLIVLLIIGIVVVMFLPTTAEEQGSNPISEAKNAATNAMIDASGIKDKAARALKDNAADIAAQTGLSEADVSQAIVGLDIPSWKATTLPNNVQSSESLSGNYAGVDGTVTLYDDPRYVTVNAYGQDVTLAVPDSAQAYLSYLDTSVVAEYLAQAA